MFLEWMLVTGSLAFGSEGWGGVGPKVRDPNAALLLGQQAQVAAWSKANGRGLPPGATVEVTAAGEREAEVIRSFVRWVTPMLQAAAVRGYEGRESVQMLGEFMAQDPNRPRPPALGRFHYNIFSPPPQSRVRR